MVTAFRRKVGTGPNPRPHSGPTTNDLGRRVLAHERTLTSLFVALSEDQPGVPDHPSPRFTEAPGMVRPQQDHAETDDDAEEFLRIAAAQRDADESRRSSLGPLHPRINAGSDATLVPVPARPRDCVHTQTVNGIWTDTADGIFQGTDQRREPAQVAVALARPRIA